MTAVLEAILLASEWLVLVYFLFVNTFYALLLVSAGLELRRYRLSGWRQGLQRILSSEIAPRVSIIAPAYNEEATVVASVRALLMLAYPDLEVVVVNDGSSDGTLAVLEREFELSPVRPSVAGELPYEQIRRVYRSQRSPGLVVIDKQNGGKADALNAGLDTAAGELVCAIDADTLIEPDALLRIVRPFVDMDDVVATGGTIRVVNGSRVEFGRVPDPRVPRRALAGAQTIEYLRAFLFGRLGWNRLGDNLIVSGAFGMFRRDAMVAAGGYEHETVGEDMELIVNLRRRAVTEGTASRVTFVPDPVAWTEVPESVRILGRQRDRWQRGLFDTLRRHAKLLLNPRFGKLGIVVFPYFVFVELLGPVIEALGLIGLAAALILGVVDWEFALLFFLVAYGYGLILSSASLVLEQYAHRPYRRTRDRLLLGAWTIFESIGYRQMTVFFRLKGMLNYLRGNQNWGQMTRRGFEASDPPPPPASGKATSG